jgi:molybdenum cofactor biosynthesis protein B
MSVEEHRERAADGAFGFAVVTVSDSRDASSDRGGPLLAELVESAEHRVAGRRLVTDDATAIASVVGELLADPAVDVVLVTGGTGVAPRDVTVEAVRPLLEKELPGFGELFRALSYEEIGAAAILSRATAGVARGKAVFLLPGSPPALDLAATKLILPEIRHLLDQARRS